jgi:hypothetical protein
VVAALPGFGNVDFRPVAPASLRDTFGRFPLGSRGRSHVRVVDPGALNRLRKRQRRLRNGRLSHSHGDDQE